MSEEEKYIPTRIYMMLWTTVMDTDKESAKEEKMSVVSTREMV